MTLTPRIAAVLAAGAAVVAAPLHAQSFGDYAHDSLVGLALDYPGRHTGSPVFQQASDFMAGRLDFGGNAVVRQDFDTSRGPSHNLLVTMPGASDDFIVVGAHFDTAGSFPDLQGVDDNGSGAAVLTELAGHMSGLETETGLVFAGFGAEEIGLVGSRHYAETLTEAERENLAGMINIDSLITGDFMYAHAGSNYLDNPQLKSFWTRIHGIAEELGIDLRSNPGLNPDYPVDTGCCSDGASFEGFDIPVLWLESTNWEIGDLDGYQQTENPAIPGGATWHDPETDNWDFLEAALGEERIPQRLQDYSLLLTRLLVELTGADLIASAREAGATGYRMSDLLTRHTGDLRDLALRGAAGRLDAPAEIGRLAPVLTVEGALRPEGSDHLGQDDGASARILLGGAWQMSETLSLGGTLAYGRSKDDLTGGGDLTAKGAAVGLDLAWRSDAFWGIAGLGWGKTSLEGGRDFVLMSGLDVEILRRHLSVDSDAYTLGAGFEAGYDLETADGLRFGPVLGFDYARHRIKGFTEGGDPRLGMTLAGQRFESAEIAIGGRLSKTATLGATPVTFSARAAFVHELADGLPERLVVTDSAGTAREIAFGETDKNFGRLGASAEFQLSPMALGWVSVSGRVGHDAGSQAAVGAGMSIRF